jgi:hypothetical protein
MFQSTNTYMDPGVLGHYVQLCAAYGTVPTTAQILDIKLAAGAQNDRYVERRFEYGLLYFLLRSTIVFEHDTLLLGWLHQSNGTKQEIWYKLDETRGRKHFSRLSYQRGAPRRSEYKSAGDICDEWHPSLAAICVPSIRSDPRLRYAYFTSTVRLIKASPPPPSIEDSTADRPKLTITLRRAGANDTTSQNNIILPTPRHSLIGENDGLDAGLEEDTISNQSEALRRAETATNNNIPGTGSRNREITEITRPNRLSHDENSDRERKRARRAVVLEILDSDSEDENHEIKIEPVAIAAPLAIQEDNIPTEQKIRDKLQNKRVHEIQDMLAERLGEFPLWIENIIKEEMEKKKARDLTMVENFF